MRLRRRHGQEHADDVVLVLFDKRQAERPAAYVRLSRRAEGTRAAFWEREPERPFRSFIDHTSGIAFQDKVLP